MPSSLAERKDMITLLVGPTHEPITVLASTLTSASPFFSALLHGSWSEGNTSTYRLPEDRPATIRGICFCLNSSVDKYIARLRKERKCWKKITERLTRLLIVADKYELIEVKEDVLQKLFDRREKLHFALALAEEGIEAPSGCRDLKAFVLGWWASENCSAKWDGEAVRKAPGLAAGLISLGLRGKWAGHDEKWV